MNPDDVSADLMGLPRHEPDGDLHSRVPVEMLVSEYLDALRVGKSPSVDEYVVRYPEHEAELRRLIPLVAAMEEWKTDKEEESPPCPIPKDFHLDRLGDCRIVREIGRGGMGVVFEAIQESLNRRVAVKLLPWRFGNDELWRARFQREARLAASLRHANIVPVYRFGEYEGFCYYVMPFIVGMGLDWVIERMCHDDGAVYAHEIERARLGTGVDVESVESIVEKADENAVPDALKQRTSDAELSSRQLAAGSWKKIAKIGAQAAAAMRYAHNNGLLHRDIKPANLLLDTNGVVWITDFGLAQPIDQVDQVAQTQSVAGTLRYMSPEQMDGKADERSDIYSLGLTLYELLTLKHAFTADSRRGLMKAIREGAFVPVREAAPNVPRALAQIVTKAIALDPADRFPSADAMTTALLASINRDKVDRPASLFGRLRSWWS